MADENTEKKDTAAAEARQNELSALRLFQGDMAAFQRLYTYLSQIFDYGNTAIEKRSIFYRQVLRLLEFGREREGIDLSKVVLTHHNLKSQGKQPMPLGEGMNPKLEPITDAGGGLVQEKQKALLNEIIQKVNDLFDGDLTDQDKLVYVNDVIKGKLLESQKLAVQATNNTKEQFANSPPPARPSRRFPPGLTAARRARTPRFLPQRRQPGCGLLRHHAPRPERRPFPGSTNAFPFPNTRCSNARTSCHAPRIAGRTSRRPPSSVI